MPSRKSGPTKPPPTLWAQFQIETIWPRSFCDHQCTIVRPHGGQPMPWNQPFRNSRQNMIETLEVAQGTKPISRKMEAESSNPTVRKTRGLERSETTPIKTFENP